MLNKLKSWYNQIMTGTTRDIILAVIIGILAGLSSTFIIKTESFIEGFLYSTHTNGLDIAQIFTLKNLIILFLPLTGALFYVVVKSLFF